MWNSFNWILLWSLEQLIWFRVVVALNVRRYKELLADTVKAAIISKLLHIAHALKDRRRDHWSVINLQLSLWWFMFGLLGFANLVDRYVACWLAALRDNFAVRDVYRLLVQPLRLLLGLDFFLNEAYFFLWWTWTHELCLCSLCFRFRCILVILNIWDRCSFLWG